MFSSRLKALRMEQKISQAELGRRVHVSQQVVGQWESGPTSPAPETVAELAAIFGVSADYLLGRSDKKTPTTETGSGQAQKLAQGLRDIGIDADSLTESEIRRIVKLAQAAFGD